LVYVLTCVLVAARLVAGDLASSAFLFFDTNRDGKLTLADLPVDATSDQRDTMVTIISLADGNHDGAVTLAEFRAATTTLQGITDGTTANRQQNPSAVSDVDVDMSPNPLKDRMRARALSADVAGEFITDETDRRIVQTLGNVLICKDNTKKWDTCKVSRLIQFISRLFWFEKSFAMQRLGSRCDLLQESVDVPVFVRSGGSALECHWLCPRC